MGRRSNRVGEMRKRQSRRRRVAELTPGQVQALTTALGWDSRAVRGMMLVPEGHTDDAAYRRARSLARRAFRLRPDLRPPASDTKRRA
jgi:hypothetical protein